MDKNLFIRNFIFGLFISVGLFIGLNCFCNASTVKSINLKHGSNFPQDTNYKTTVTFSSSPSFSIDTYIDTYSPNTSHTYPYYCNLHVTTSNGDYIIKSSKGTFTANDHSTVTNNLGLASAGTYTLPGYFINSYLEYSCGYLDDGYGNIYLQSTGSTVNPAYTGTYNTMNYLSNFDINGVNSNYVSFNNSILSVDSDYPCITYQSDYRYFGGDYYRTNLNKYSKLTGVLNKSFFTVNSSSFDAITINFWVNYENGNNVKVCSKSFTSTEFINLSANDQIFNFTNQNIYYDTCPSSVYITYDVYGSYDKVLSFGNISTIPLDWVSFFYDPLNVIDTREQSDWTTIGGSDELSNLGDTSTSIESILSDNNTFEESAFTSLDDSLDDYNFDDWSLLPAEGGMKFGTYLITSFYNLLPFKVQWLFTTVISFGLISMLLTVGTRVVQRTGEFTRARPIRVSEKHIYHHKSK